MSVLSNLKLSDTSPRAKLSPVARKRQKLLEQIDLQLKAAVAFLSNEQFVQEVQRWARVEGSDDKQLVTRKKSVRPWWWRNDVGRLMLSVRAATACWNLLKARSRSRSALPRTSRRPSRLCGRPLPPASSTTSFRSPLAVPFRRRRLPSPEYPAEGTLRP